MTSTLTEFLLARLAEDEAEAGWPSFVSSYGKRTARRQLADVEAKRCIVELHKPDAGGEACSTCADWTDRDHGVAGVDYPCPTLRLLAPIYADHESFDESWRP